MMKCQGERERESFWADRHTSYIVFFSLVVKAKKLSICARDNVNGQTELRIEKRYIPLNPLRKKEQIGMNEGDRQRENENE